MNAMKVLLLEDKCENAKTARDALCSKGMELTIVRGYHEAKEIMANESFDFYLFDCNVPYSTNPNTFVPDSFAREIQTLDTKHFRDIPSEVAIDIVENKVPEYTLPLGYLFAKKFSEESRTNYLLTTSVIHNLDGFEEDKKFYQEKGIRAKIAHQGRGDPKQNISYWNEVAKEILGEEK